MIAEAYLRATSTNQQLSHRKVAHELRDRNGFAYNNLTPRMMKTAVRCIALIRKHNAVPSDHHPPFVVSNVDDVDPNAKYSSITITIPAMLQIPQQMQAALGAVALQSDSQTRSWHPLGRCVWQNISGRTQKDLGTAVVKFSVDSYGRAA